MSKVVLEDLLTNATPFIDVRAPAEFATGAVPGAVNLPLLDDDERHQVGLAYKEQGSSVAVGLGESLVSGSVRQQRIHAWATMAGQHEHAWLYCWRGGMRSQIAQSWLAETGVEIPRVAGGFKSLRNCCLAVLARAATEKDWLVLAGRTGSGKTIVIRERSDSIDLEGLANHRGSAFGAQPCGQPTPVDFENSLAVAFLQLPSKRLLLEDESRTIGRLALPAAWHERMQRAPLVVLEKSMAARVANIRQEYVDEPLSAGTAPGELLARYQGSLERIRKRLGGARYTDVAGSLSHGFDTGEHERWIEQLLTWYYDPMYDYQLENKRERILARGDADHLRDYLGH